MQKKQAGNETYTLTEEHLLRMCIPKVHWSASVSKIPNKCSHKRYVTSFIENIKENVQKPTGLLLFGPYSAGKSGIAALCLKAAATKGVIGYWISAADLPSYQIEKQRFDDYVTCYERARTVPLLVIDEYFMRQEMKWTEDAVDALVRNRIDNKVCTILTTNHVPNKIKDCRPALAAALQEATFPVKVEGIDFRKNKELSL